VETLAPGPGRPSQHTRDPGRWQTIRYALETWPRTLRLLVILTVPVACTSVIIDLVVRALLR
jgi:hypothetical protein